MSEIIYLLTNPTIPDLVKIGRTTNLEQRIRSLSSHSGVAVPFECFHASEVTDANEVEQALHDGFADHRINNRREFFRIDPERVLSILKLREVRDVTPSEDIVEDEDERETLERERKRARARFSFPMLGIEPGSIITFYTDETLTAKVVDDYQIEFEGELQSVTKAARTILLRTNPDRQKVTDGPPYWKFEGETLRDRRKRMEKPGMVAVRMSDNSILGLVCSYYISKFNEMAYEHLGYSSQQECHNILGDLLQVGASTIKQNRDQFDSVHDNGRVGWFQRPLPPSRRNAVHALEELDEPSLLDLVREITTHPVGEISHNVIQAVHAGVPYTE